MGAAAKRYGINDDNWERLIAATIEVLKQVASRGGVTNYSDLNREISDQTGLPRFDFTHPEGRNALSELLGEVVERTVDEIGGMLSAVVIYTDGNKPGPGFFHLAVELRDLPADADEGAKLKFWNDEIRLVQAACKAKRRRR